jgi:putative transposase
MNKAKCEAEDYIQFLIAAQKTFSTVEAANSHPAESNGPAHDAYTRLLERLPPDSAALWAEVSGHVDKTRGMLVIDDSTLDKPHARHMELVSRHWSGKQHQVVQGINLVSLVWTDGDCCLPVDYRIYHKDSDGLTKNDHFRAMLNTAKARGLEPVLVAFDGWYASLDNLKQVRTLGWHWLTRLKSNRQVSLSIGNTLAVIDIPDIPRDGRLVHLTGYGQIRLFRLVATNGDVEHWATNILTLTEDGRASYANRAWRIDEYHRSLKQFTGIERGQFRRARRQHNHIGLALRAFVRLELQRVHFWISHAQAKTSIIRDAIRLYRANPSIRLPSTA